MGSGGSGRRNLWLSLSKSLRVSAWLPPGLALGWLATLATLIHSVAVAVGDWAGTVSLAILLLLLTRRRQPSPKSDSSGTVFTEPVAAGTAAAPASARPSTAADVAGKHQAGPSHAASPIASEFPVLTAGQVAVAFGVEERLVIEAISGGHLPGNQFAGKWLIHQGTLIRWLRGSYRESAAEDPGR